MDFTVVLSDTAQSPGERRIYSGPDVNYTVRDSGVLLIHEGTKRTLLSPCAWKEIADDNTGR